MLTDRLDHQWRRHLRLRRTRPKRREIRQVGWRGQRVHRPTRPELQAGAGAGNRLLRPTTTRRRAPATPSRPWKNYVPPPPEVARAPWNEPTPGRATAVVRGELPLPIGTDPAPRGEEDDAPAFAGPGQDASSSSRDAAKESLARELAVERLQERLGSSRPLTAPATSPA